MTSQIVAVNLDAESGNRMKIAVVWWEKTSAAIATESTSRDPFV